MPRSRKVFVAGHRGMVGSAILRELERRGYESILTRTHDELDLTNQAKVRAFFEHEAIDIVYTAAAKVGGILANSTYPAEFIYQNLMIELNIIHEAWASGVQRLLLLGSSCIYPRSSRQPIAETALLTGELEPTNEAYAIAKIAGIKTCQAYNREHGADFRCLMPTNLFGPGDSYDLQNGHVIPALIRRFHEAKVARLTTVPVWGTGMARREFLYVEDLAAAAIQIMEMSKDEYERAIEPATHLNVGTGKDIAIGELAKLVKETVGFTGSIVFDRDKPDGMPRKLLDVSRISRIGWRPSVSLREGLQICYADFLRRESSNSTM